MEGSPSIHLAGAIKRFAKLILAIGENRFQLFVAEAQEERDRLLGIIFLALATAALGLLAAIVLSAAVVMIFWPASPVGSLLVLGAAYMIAAGVVYGRLLTLHRRQNALAGTLDQLRKDRACLK